MRLPRVTVLTPWLYGDRSYTSFGQAFCSGGLYKQGSRMEGSMGSLPRLPGSVGLGAIFSS